MTAAPGLHGWTISIDLWGTLITDGDHEAAAAWRVREFTLVLAELGHPRYADTVRDAITEVRDLTRRRQRSAGEQPTTHNQVAAILARLGIPDQAPLIEVLAIPHTHAALRACPEQFPGARTCLQVLRQEGARVVLTSNTLATSPAVTRRIVDDLQLGDLFDDTLFSGDLGVAKPRHEVFATVAARAHLPPDRVVHVGDSVTTDIRGAQRAGCRAVLVNHAGKPCPPGVPDASSLALLPDAVRLACAGPPPSPGSPHDAHRPRSSTRQPTHRPTLT